MARHSGLVNLSRGLRRLLLYNPSRFSEHFPRSLSWIASLDAFPLSERTPVFSYGCWIPARKLVRSKQDSKRPEDERKLWPWGSLGAVLGLAATQVVLAESPSKDGGDLKAAAAAAQTAMIEAWQQAEDDRSRHAAHLPAGVALPPGWAPTTSLLGDTLVLNVPLRDANNVAGVMASIMQLLEAGKSTSRSIQRQQSGGSQVITIESRASVAVPGQPHQPGIWLQLLVPAPGGRDAPRAELTVKKAAPFCKDELQALGALVLSANSVDPAAALARGRRPDVLSDIFVHGADPAEALARAMDDAMREMAQLHGGLFSRLFREFVGDEDQPRFPQKGPWELPPGSEEDGDRSWGQPRLPDSFEGREESEVLPPTAGLDMDASPLLPPPLPPPRRTRGRPNAVEGYDYGSPQANQAAQALQGLGAQVFPPGKKEQVDWGLLAGYESQKRAIEDCLLLPLQRPEVYEAVARGTRTQYASNRPRAVLFEGPPGTGKTTSARVISSQAALPLVYIPLEAIVSKWYGESEQLLSKVFKSAEALGGAILFLDELDALATSRDSDLHEASRRLLSVLLRELDGFTSGRRSVVIGATNRKQDLDAALLSRFDMTVNFGLPDEQCRRLILARYAKQLNEDDIVALASRMIGMSGRDLRDVCEQTERRWASKIIRGQAQEGELPPLEEYMESAQERVAAGEHPHGYHPLPGFTNTALPA